MFVLEVDLNGIQIIVRIVKDPFMTCSDWRAKSLADLRGTSRYDNIMTFEVDGE